MHMNHWVFHCCVFLFLPEFCLHWKRQWNVQWYWPLIWTMWGAWRNKVEEWAWYTLDCSETVTVFLYLLSNIHLFSEGFQANQSIYIYYLCSNVHCTRYSTNCQFLPFFVCLFVFDCSYSVSLFLAPLIKKSEAVRCGSVWLNVFRLPTPYWFFHFYIYPFLCQWICHMC